MWNKRVKINLVLLVLCFILIIGCSAKQVSLDDRLLDSNDVSNTITSVDEVVGHEPEPNHKRTPVLTQEITVAAIGDILIHSRVYDDAKVNDGYNFMPMIEELETYLKDATISFANQETMIGGVEHGLSTYPAFNSPTEVGDALKEVGIDIVSIANNHTLDRGEKVIQSAIKHWDAIDMMYVGAYKDDEDQQNMRIIETDEGISVAFLAYTYGTNGIPIPNGKDYLVNLIDRETIANDIKIAKNEADVTIVSLHFGKEYERMPSEEQKDLVQFVADEGAHAVLGHHPHVLQPAEWVEGKDGNETFVIYSLGNLLSGQDKLYRQIGGMIKFSITKETVDDAVSIDLHSPQFLPTYNASEANENYRVIPMHEVSDDILPEAKSHYKEIKHHMTQWMPELEFMTP